MLAKLATPALGAWLLAAVDSQPYIVVGAFILTLVFGWRAYKVRDFNAEIAGLKAAIETHETIKRGDDELIRQLQRELTGAEARARQLEIDMQKWKSAHDALVPYSAGPAFEKLEELIAQMARQGDERHRQTTDLIRRLVGEKSVTNPQNLPERP